MDLSSFAKVCMTKESPVVSAVSHADGPSARVPPWFHRSYAARTGRAGSAPQGESPMNCPLSFCFVFTFVGRCHGVGKWDREDKRSFADRCRFRTILARDPGYSLSARTVGRLGVFVFFSMPFPREIRSCASSGVEEGRGKRAEFRDKPGMHRKVKNKRR